MCHERTSQHVDRWAETYWYLDRRNTSVSRLELAADRTNKLLWSTTNCRVVSGATGRRFAGSAQTRKTAIVRAALMLFKDS